MAKKIRKSMVIILAITSQYPTFSSGFLKKIVLNRMGKQLTYQKPSIITPKKMNSAVMWLTSLIQIPFFFNSEKQKLKELQKLETLQKNKSSDNLIQKNLLMDPARIIVIDDDILKLEAAAYDGMVLISASIYNLLASDDESKRQVALGILAHEHEHVKRGHTTQYKQATYYTAISLFNLAAMTAGGKIYSLFFAGKKAIRGKAKIRAAVNASMKGFFKGTIVQCLSALTFLKKRKDYEYDADNIYVPDKPTNLLLLKGFKASLEDVNDIYNYLRETGLTKKSISFRELFLSHPDTKERIERIDHHIRRLELSDQKEDLKTSKNQG